MSKDLEYYRSIHYKMVWEYDNDDKVYFVRFPELPGCLAHGKTEQKALKAALKIKDEWLEATYAAGWQIPEPSVVPETTGRVTLRLPKFLHQKVIDKADEEGVSQNQLILSYIAQGLQKAPTEDLLKKMAGTQDEIARLLKRGQFIENVQSGGNLLSSCGFLVDASVYPASAPNVLIYPYSSGLLWNPTPGTAVTTAGTTEVIYSVSAPTGETKEKLRLISNANVSSEEDCQGGYANEAKSRAQENYTG